jgi:hypothetical protein
MSLTIAELEQLYSEPSVRDYAPQAVLTHLLDGGTVAALCYNLPRQLAAAERNPDYAAKLRALAERVGLPKAYVASIA